ncbi:YraN family protein [Marinobacter zhejiangensis]|uniref:UPF0102 protein SAMN04487963_3524 n=1 Tax=Marinobacter zhejiangensis TaxID=488535 RepID=A0A1I4TA57_9GAMM|nr:YraN family protein [Marinobacter zhejiangensis]SFM73678.1 putative endonuclease [Marinobacter zhejiangensis]
MNSKKLVGDQAELVAARYLARRGVKILERNVYSRGGEIDLIGQDGPTLVFFEVRFRGNGALTGPAESIGYQKQRRLLRAVEYYLHRHGKWDCEARIDVIAMSPGRWARYDIQWIKNAIQG